MSEEFCRKVIGIAERLGVKADWLMACMAFETGRSFDPAQKNLAGSGATGLIQFMPSTALGLSTTVDKLAQMTALEQLDYVEAYFEPYKGRMNSLGDIYMAILWPAGIGRPDEYVLWRASQRPTTYRQNSGLDANNDRVITKAETTSRLNKILAEGREHSRPVAV